MLEMNSTMYRQLVYLTAFIGFMWIGFSVNKFVLWCNEPPPPPSPQAQALINSIHSKDGWSVKEGYIKQIVHTSGIVVRIGYGLGDGRYTENAGFKFYGNDQYQIRDAAEEEFEELARREIEKKLKQNP